MLPVLIIKVVCEVELPVGQITVGKVVMAKVGLGPTEAVEVDPAPALLEVDPALDIVEVDPALVDVVDRVEVDLA